MNLDTEFQLTSGNQTAIVSPFGASLRRFFLETEKGEWNVIWGYSGGASKMGGQGDVLIPFPGRIKGGDFRFEGRAHQLAKNDKDGPNAIHGFLRATLFDVAKQSKDSITFTYQISESAFAEKGYPFTLHVEIIYSISEAGLTTRYKITNLGNQSAPVGVGFHPYFRAFEGDLADWKLEIPARDYIELENLVPTGRVLPVANSKLDFKHGLQIKDEKYNDCLTHLERDVDGFALISLSHVSQKAGRVVLRLDEAFDHVVVYTGDQIASPNQRQGFAIEPMTCAPDAFNHPGWGTRHLEPGSEMTGHYTVQAKMTVGD